MNNIIDLDALSTQVRTDMPSLQAMFAVAGDTLTATVQDRWNLVIHALIRMALGGGYLDAQARLVALAAA
jgi:hypothetical protein